MVGQSFWWLAIFEEHTPVDIPQADGTSRTVVVTLQRYTRNGTINVSPGQRTDETVSDIEEQCKAGGGVPQEALLTGVQFVPNLLVPRS